MTLNAQQRLGMRALVVNSNLRSDCVSGRAIRLLTDNLVARGVNVVEAMSANDASVINAADSAIQCVILDWDIGKGVTDHKEASKVLGEIRAHNTNLPIFLLANRSRASSIPLEAMQQADDFVWLLDDTPDFIGGRVVAAMERYRGQILPPMFGALARFSKIYEYSWHTPGHAGGAAFLKHPAGRAFFEFFGEDLFRSDLSISVGELGSLLDHTGPIGESEKYVAQVFGSHRSYHVTNGSSTSNRIILMASVTRNDITLCDRNCHKSAEHAMTLSGALPVWMVPSRNHLGIIGPIYPERLTKTAIKKAIGENPMVTSEIDPTPVHAILTNSTYDGLCYNARRVAVLLGQSVDRVHFDEAWYGYARFNPLYKDRFGMFGDAKDYDQKTGPTIFTTHSTHKLLAALSQASFIHVRDGRKPIEHSRFNESFMMHSSTSPQYAIIASNDVAAAMMDGPSGPALTTESIREAVAFRQTMARVNAEFKDRKEWFFNAWQPEQIETSKGKKVPFHEAPEEKLVTDPSCWVLHPGDAWHGFPDLEDDYCMLDPIKVSVVTPGLGLDGELEKSGIPASVVTAYLANQGIMVEKTTNFTILFLFSIGITQGKWGSLINAFLDFKRDYDANAPLNRALPKLTKDNPGRYDNMGLKDLSTEMFEAMRKLKSVEYMSLAFKDLPKVEKSPVETYEHLVKGDIESLTLDQAANRVAAVAIVPYPPGIPMSIPGENMGPANGPILGYLKSLEAFDTQFPGFGHDTHGVENLNGKYHIHCLKKETSSAKKK